MRLSNTSAFMPQFGQKKQNTPESGTSHTTVTTKDGKKVVESVTTTKYPEGLIEVTRTEGRKA